MEISDDDKFLILDWNDVLFSVSNWIQDCHDLEDDVLDPETAVIVGLTRGGLTPAVVMSHATGIGMHALDYSSNRGNGEAGRPNDKFPVDLLTKYSTILIVDEIVDTGHTMKDLFDEIQDLIDENNLKNQIRTFSIVYKEMPNSAFTPNYYTTHVAPDSCDKWVVFPWEVNPYIVAEE